MERKKKNRKRRTRYDDQDGGENFEAGRYYIPRWAHNFPDWIEENYHGNDMRDAQPGFSDFPPASHRPDQQPKPTSRARLSSNTPFLPSFPLPLFLLCFKTTPSSTQHNDQQYPGFLPDPLAEIVVERAFLRAKSLLSSKTASKHNI